METKNKLSNKIGNVVNKITTAFSTKREDDQSKGYPKLKKMGIYQSENGNLVSPAVSKFSSTYYDDFEYRTEPFPNSFPFLITLDRNNIELLPSHSINGEADSVAVEQQPTRKKSISHLIDYEDESDYQIIYNHLSELDKRVLNVISEFRNVQYLQLIKELGDVKSNRITKSLKRLHGYYLIEKHSFNRGDREDGSIAYSYSIYSHGTMLLLKYSDINPRYAYKWKEQSKRGDKYSPIRHWKIFDAYLNIRTNRDYVGFASYSYLAPFTYTDTIVIKKGNKKRSEQAEKALGKVSGEKTKDVIRRVPGVRFEGQLITHSNKTGVDTKFDLYPFITDEEYDSDLSKLGSIFKHYGHFEDGFDEEGNRRFLLIIVDSIKQIEKIEERYRLSEGYRSLGNILFLNLETASDNYLKSIKIIQENSDGERDVKTLSFAINEDLLELA